MADEEQAASESGKEKRKTIKPIKVYLKDASFEAPNSPGLFTEEWEPEFNVDMKSSTSQQGDSIFEVIFSMTITTTVGQRTAYLAEVHQAGLFELSGFDPEKLQRAQNVFCLNYVYPYASASLSELIVKGGFPQFHFNPPSFNAAYEQHLREKQAEAGEPEPESETESETESE
jgi:preprotein translocase subunit SecB